MSAAEVLTAALALSDGERERLALNLWDSLQDDGVGAVWASEIERRVHAIRNGEAELFSHEEAESRVLCRLESLRR